MRCFPIVFFLFWIASGHALSQVTPTENDTLNYLIAGFSFTDGGSHPTHTKDSFRVTLATGRFTDEQSFGSHIVQSVIVRGTRTVLRLPSFGQEYTWRVQRIAKGKPMALSGFHHFSTGYSTDADTTFVRLKVTQKATAYDSGLVILDGNRAMYDMKGNPVWYLPNIPGKINANTQVRDFKFTDDGTITFLADGNAYEVNYSGKILWEGADGRQKKGDSLEAYHHELTKLKNGHYMALSMEPMARITSFPTDSNGKRIRFPDSARKPLRRLDGNSHFGVIMEYDQTGKRIWEWSGPNFFRNYDLEFYKKGNGMPEYDVHQNSFFFDDKNKAIYVSYRNISQILKISYPSGQVTRIYGRLSYYLDSMELHPFCGQHSIKLSADGDIYLFNNACGPTARPGILVLKQPETDKEPLKVVWEYKCPVEVVDRSKIKATNAALLNKRYSFSSGGSVNELPDHSFFVSTNEPYNKLFIVSRDKELHWMAEAEKWQVKTNSWMPNAQYRANIITNSSELEKLVWSAFR